MKFPYNVMIDGVFYPTGTEIVYKAEQTMMRSDSASFDEMSISELKAYAAEHNIKPTDLRRKEAIITAIRKGGRS